MSRALDHLHFLYEALESEIGIAIPVSEPEILRNLLYTARRTSKDIDLDGLILWVPAKLSEVWITHKIIEEPLP